MRINKDKNSESLNKRHNNTTHGMSSKTNPSSEYSSYQNAKNRCENPNNPSYDRYGGRGIKFLFEDFIEFYQELGEKPKPKSSYSVERINNDGHYEKGNVRWATRKEQNNNTRANVNISFNGQTWNIAQWSKIVDINRYTLYERYEKGWSIEKMLTTRPRQKKIVK